MSLKLRIIPLGGCGEIGKNMTVFEYGDQIIIVDAGTGIRRLGNHLVEEGRYTYNLILTHAHWDHLMGFPFFKQPVRLTHHYQSFWLSHPLQRLQSSFIAFIHPTSAYTHG